ncbi:hypothetical protein EXIGLDRAFT_809880 [Exidia glandulosa HHB12029]|uniref:Uncharacterized protein n=1 Tax=Exidia glandulosa HHB12029 TaxID=1314781 RepID=A0A165CS40_EXIGL|nr:hypothetical protein EXIGLDRAFT_809880 [Exidia glandulosa HHB12029]
MTQLHGVSSRDARPAGDLGFSTSRAILHVIALRAWPGGGGGGEVTNKPYTVQGGSSCAVTGLTMGSKCALFTASPFQDFCVAASTPSANPPSSPVSTTLRAPPSNFFHPLTTRHTSSLRSRAPKPTLSAKEHAYSSPQFPTRQLAPSMPYASTSRPCPLPPMPRCSSMVTTMTPHSRVTGTLKSSRTLSSLRGSIPQTSQAIASAAVLRPLPTLTGSPTLMSSASAAGSRTLTASTSTSQLSA